MHCKNRHREIAKKQKRNRIANVKNMPCISIMLRTLEDIELGDVSENYRENMFEKHMEEEREMNLRVYSGSQFQFQRE